MSRYNFYLPDRCMRIDDAQNTHSKHMRSYRLWVTYLNKTLNMVFVALSKSIIYQRSSFVYFASLRLPDIWPIQFSWDASAQISSSQILENFQAQSFPKKRWLAISRFNHIFRNNNLFTLIALPTDRDWQNNVWKGCNYIIGIFTKDPGHENGLCARAANTTSSQKK